MHINLKVKSQKKMKIVKYNQKIVKLVKYKISEKKINLEFLSIKIKIVVPFLNNSIYNFFYF